jgi:hypothetical protein
MYLSGHPTIEGYFAKLATAFKSLYTSAKQTQPIKFKVGGTSFACSLVSRLHRSHILNDV